MCSLCTTSLKVLSPPVFWRSSSSSGYLELTVEHPCQFPLVRYLQSAQLLPGGLESYIEGFHNFVLVICDPLLMSAGCSVWGTQDYLPFWWLIEQRMMFFIKCLFLPALHIQWRAVFQSVTIVSHTITCSMLKKINKLWQQCVYGKNQSAPSESPFCLPEQWTWLWEQLFKCQGMF